MIVVKPAPLDLESTVAAWLRPPRAKGGVVGLLDEKVGLGTRAGTHKDINEDRLLCAQLFDREGAEATLIVVCDGMGGMRAGARCAELGISTFVLSLSRQLGQGTTPAQALHNATQYANDRVWREHRGDGGTTLTAVLLHREQTWACTVGDSRLFGYGAMGLRQLSRDDTLEGALASVNGHSLAHGNNPRRDSERQRLVQFLGMGEGLEEHIIRVESELFRYLFICSDGAYDPAGPMLPAIAAFAKTPKLLAERLCALAEWVGGPDDASVAVIDSSPIANGLLEREPTRLLRIWGPAAGSAGGLLLTESHAVARPTPVPSPQITSAPASIETKPLVPIASQPASVAVESQVKKDKRKPSSKRSRKSKKETSLPLKANGGDLIVEIEKTGPEEEPEEAYADVDESDTYGPTREPDDERRRSYR